MQTILDTKHKKVNADLLKNVFITILINKHTQYTCTPNDSHTIYIGWVFA